MEVPTGRQLAGLMSAARVLAAWQSAAGSGEDELAAAIGRESAPELLLGLINLCRHLSIDVAILTQANEVDVIPAAISRVMGLTTPLSE